MRRRYLVSFAAVCFLVLASLPTEAQSVRLGLDWLILAQHSPYIIALEKGYWKEAGLDVQVSRGWGSADGVRRLVNRASDIVFADAGALAVGRAKGAKAKLVAMMYAKAPFAFYSKPKSGILKPKDLEGKTVGAPPGDGTRVVFPAFAKLVGIDTSKVKWIDVDPGAKAPMVMADKMDAATNYLFERVTWRRFFTPDKGGLNEMFLYQYGFNVYGNGLMALDEDIEAKAEVVRKVTQGALRGYQYALDHMDEAAAIFAKKYPTQNPGIIRDVLPVLKEVVLSPEVLAKCIGWIEDSIMERTAKVMLEAYNVKEPVNHKDLYTRAFLPCK